MKIRPLTQETFPKALALLLQAFAPGKQEVQLKDGQRKITELQDKLDSLADIERTLTPRPRAVRHEGGRP